MKSLPVLALLLFAGCATSRQQIPVAGNIKSVLATHEQPSLTAGITKGISKASAKVVPDPTHERPPVLPPIDPPAPPTLDEPATTKSVFLIQCPQCKENMMLAPKEIQSTGGRSVPNGVIQTRSLHFQCIKRFCGATFSTQDEVFVEPVKAVRVR